MDPAMLSRDVIEWLVGNAEKACLSGKAPEELTPEEKLGICFCAGVRIDHRTTEKGMELFTVVPCGITLVDGKYYVAAKLEKGGAHEVQTGE